jgi:hypothetical protein
VVGIFDDFILRNVEGSDQCAPAGVRPTVIAIHKVPDYGVGFVEVARATVKCHLRANDRKREDNSGTLAQPPRPGPCAQDDGLGSYLPARGRDVSGSAFLNAYFQNFHAFFYAYAHPAGGIRVTMKHEGGVHISGLRLPGADLIGAEIRSGRHFRKRLPGPEVRVGSRFLHEPDVALRRRSVPAFNDEQAAHVPPSRILSGMGFEFSKRQDSITGHLDQKAGGVVLAYDGAGSSGRPGADKAFLQHAHRSRAGGRQMVGNADAHNAAPYYDDIGRVEHGFAGVWTQVYRYAGWGREFGDDRAESCPRNSQGLSPQTLWLEKDARWRNLSVKSIDKPFRKVYS